MTIDFGDTWSIDFLEQINGKYRLPHMKEIHVNSLEFVNSECRRFLKSTITTCEELYINKKPLAEHIKSKVDIDYYLDCFKLILGRVVKQTCLFGYFNIKAEQFNQLGKHLLISKPLNSSSNS